MGSQSVQDRVRANTRARRAYNRDANNMGGGICARQLARTSRGVLGAVMGGQQSVARRLQSTETLADKIQIQAEQSKSQPARLPTDVFAQKNASNDPPGVGQGVYESHPC